MAMTIEKIKEIASDYLNDKESTSEMEELFEEFIQIKEKYQKIEQIISSWELGLIDNVRYEISEVLEDGGAK